MYIVQNPHYRSEIYHDVSGETKLVNYYAPKTREGLNSVYNFIAEKEKELTISRVEVYFVNGEEEEFVDLL